VVAVVTDSAANVPGDVARDLGIGVVPIHLRFGSEDFLDGIDMVGGDFYEQLVAANRVASSSAPSPGEFLEVFEATGGEDIVCVTVASAVSVTHHEAVLAAERYEGRVEVVDSHSATMGEGFVAIEAARAARAGSSLEEVAARAREVASRARVFGAIETFEFLKRSGRVNKLQAYAATMLDIKPVFQLREGEIGPVARPRTRSRALARVVEETVRAAGDRPLHLAAFHARAEPDAKELVRRIEAETNTVESFVVEATPVIGAHVGPGLVGTAFFSD
jgi:DegV family protein with EDD domain